MSSIEGPPSLQLLPSFSQRELEQQFLHYQHIMAGANDGHTYMSHCFWWTLGSAWLSRRELGVCWVGVVQAGIGCLAYLAPWLIFKLANQTYLRHRRLIVTVHRLLCMLIPSVVFTYVRIPPGNGLKPTAGGMVVPVTFVAQAVSMWTLSLGLRLDLDTHVFMQLLLAARMLLTQAPAFCLAPCCTDPATMGRFQAVAYNLSSWATLASPGLQSTSGPTPDIDSLVGDPSPRHCWALVAAVHLIFGLLLPTYAAYVTECACRSKFLSMQAAALGVEVPRVGERLGLPSQEVLQVALFDPATAWLRLGLLLPPLAALTWLSMMALAASWEWPA